MEKTTVKARVDLLEALVEELLKEPPREVTIEKKMKDLEIPYSNGIINGIVYEYYENGKLRNETQYTEGIIISKLESYDETGKEIK